MMIGRLAASSLEMISWTSPTETSAARSVEAGSAGSTSALARFLGRPLPGDRSWCVWDIRCNDAERTPWFDAAHHDRFILHGAGYSSRYEGGLGNRLDLAVVPADQVGVHGLRLGVGVLPRAVEHDAETVGPSVADLLPGVEFLDR